MTEFQTTSTSPPTPAPTSTFVLTSSTAVTVTFSTPPPSTTTKASSGLSSSAIGAIAGSISAIFVIAILILGGLYWYKLKSQRNLSSLQVAELGEQKDGRTNSDFQIGTANEITDLADTEETPSGGLRYFSSEILDSGRTAGEET